MRGTTRLVWAPALAAAILATGLLVGPTVRAWLRPAGGPPPLGLETLGVYGELPDFSLTDQSGRAVSRSDLAAKVWIANFIYTTCPDTCPLQTAALARQQGELLADPRVRLVSITVDPAHDTPGVLRHYAEQYRADLRGWLFLTGSKDAIQRLARDGFKLAVAGPGQSEGDMMSWLAPRPALAAHGASALVHSSRLALVDGRARVRAYHQWDVPDSLARLRANVHRLLAEL